VHWSSDQIYANARGQSPLPPVIVEGDSFGFQLGARFQLARGILLHLLVEDNINQFYSTQLRVFALLDLAFFLNRSGFAQGLPTGIGPSLGNFANPYGTGMGY
jgi:hypothetical protein